MMALEKVPVETRIGKSKHTNIPRDACDDLNSDDDEATLEMGAIMRFSKSKSKSSNLVDDGSIASSTGTPLHGRPRLVASLSPLNGSVHSSTSINTSSQIITQLAVVTFDDLHITTQLMAEMHSCLSVTELRDRGETMRPVVTTLTPSSIKQLSGAFTKQRALLCASSSDPTQVNLPFIHFKLPEIMKEGPMQSVEEGVFSGPQLRAGWLVVIGCKATFYDLSMPAKVLFNGVVIAAEPLSPSACLPSSQQGALHGIHLRFSGRVSPSFFSPSDVTLAPEKRDFLPWLRVFQASLASPSLSKRIVAGESITLEDVVGCGAFGIVQRGRCQTAGAATALSASVGRQAGLYSAQ